MRMRRREEEEGGRLAMDEDWLFLRNWRRSNGSLPEILNLSWRVNEWQSDMMGIFFAFWRKPGPHQHGWNQVLQLCSSFAVSSFFFLPNYPVLAFHVNHGDSCASALAV